MAFDPDQYLSETEKPFDPDAYLAQPASAEFDPNQYLGTPEPQISLAPQAANIGMRAAQAVAPVVPAAASMATEGVKDWAKIAKILYQNANLGQVGEFIKEPIKTTAGAVESYVAGHPWASKVTSTTPQQALQAAGRGAANVGRALVAGAVAPESIMMLPYQMAAYEQDIIRQNPNAPGLEYNPYAQVQRGEFATQGQAAAANQRRAVINAPFGNVTPAERALLEEDQQRKLRLMMQVQAAKKVLGQQ